MLLFGGKKALSSGVEESSELIERALGLLEETKKRMKTERPGLTPRLQLQDDMKLLETSMAKYRKKPGKEQEKALEDAFLRLRTTSEHILHYTYE